MQQLVIQFFVSWLVSNKHHLFCKSTYGEKLDEESFHILWTTNSFEAYRISDARVEFDLGDSLNTFAPDGPIEFPPRLSFVRVEFDLRESLNAFAFDARIALPLRFSFVRVEFDLRASHSAEISIPQRSRSNGQLTLIPLFLGNSHKSVQHL